MPKAKLEEAIELMKEEQRKIAMINAQARIMQQSANQFLNEDVDAQASQMSEAQKQAEYAAAMQETEAEREGIDEEREEVGEEE
jgi:hypothetical protein